MIILIFIHKHNNNNKCNYKRNNNRIIKVIKIFTNNKEN